MTLNDNLLKQLSISKLLQPDLISFSRNLSSAIEHPFIRGENAVICTKGKNKARYRTALTTS
jgi:hypothetical protein